VSEESWRVVGSRLREIRTDAGLTGRDLADLVGWHSSKVSRLEYGRRIPTVADIRTWCAACGVPGEAPELIGALRAVEGAYVEWKRLERQGVRQLNQSRRSVWQQTRQFRIYANWNIPSPLQTAAYITAVLRSMVTRRSLIDDVEAAVPVRVERQTVLDRPDKSFAILIEESALGFNIGGAQTMMGQLGHLLTASTLPNVSLGIIPHNADRTLSWPVESFYVFDTDSVSVELVANYLTVSKPSEIELYLKSFADLSSLAVFGAPARRLITSAIEQLAG